MAKNHFPSNMNILNIQGQGNFQFSAANLSDLGACEYTLVTIVADISSSVFSFADELAGCVRKIVEACGKSPRSENLMVRLICFNTDISEIHGFMPLSRIDANGYAPFQPNGTTALFDAVYSGIGATVEYAKLLGKNDFAVNGCVYIITDGMDNASSVNPGQVRKKIKEARKSETLESLYTILIGLIETNETDAPNIRNALTAFQVEAELDSFVDAGDATPQRLANLADFVSRSISVHSQALGTGGQTQSLRF